MRIWCNCYETSTPGWYYIRIALLSCVYFWFDICLFFCCRKWRMFWIRPVVALVDTSIFPQCWDAIAVPPSRAFAHERSIGAGRSKFKPQWDPTARRFSPLLHVSHMIWYFARFPLFWQSIEWFRKTRNGALRLPLQKKIGENGIGERSLPPEHFASTLNFSFPTIAGGYPCRQDLILAPSDCQSLVTLGQVT